MNLYRLTESHPAWTASGVLRRYRRGDLFRLREHAGANVVVRDRSGQVVTIPRRLLEEVPEAVDTPAPHLPCESCVTQPVPAGADDGDHTGGGPVG